VGKSVRGGAESGEVGTKTSAAIQEARGLNGVAMTSNDSNEPMAAPGGDPGAAPIASVPAFRAGSSRPLFTWKYKHGVDGQGRIQFPSKWKLRAGESELIAVVVRHRLVDRDFILVLPFDLFDKFSAGLLDGGFTEPHALARRHDHSERIMSLDLDGAGRFTLPPELREPASLRKEALLVGCVDRFEIWNPKDYDEARASERILTKADNLTL
jgi:MraZ protein